MASITAGPRVGNPSSEGFSVWARTSGGIVTVTIETQRDGETEWVLGGTETTDPALDYTFAIQVTGLRPNTKYFYRILFNGQVATQIRYTRTLPSHAAGNVVLYVTSDFHGDPDVAFAAFNRIKTDYETNYEPYDIHGVIICTGDLTDGGPNNSIITSRLFDEMLFTAVPSLFTKLPFLYMWDDWDFRGNNSNIDDSTLLLVSNATASSTWDITWRDMPRPAAPSRGYSIQLGGVALIVPDMRSQKRTTALIGDATFTKYGLTGAEALSARSTCLGQAQREWLLTELPNALRNNGLVILVSTQSFADPQTSMGNGISGPLRDGISIFHRAERTAILQACHGACRNNLIVISGDDHANWVYGYAPSYAPTPATEIAGRRPAPPYAPFHVTELKVRTSNGGPVNAYASFFDDTNALFNYSAENRGCIMRFDMTWKKTHAEAHIKYIAVGSGGDTPDGQVPVDDRGRRGEFYYKTGAFTAVKDFQLLTGGVMVTTGGPTSQKFPPENNNLPKPKFERGFIDDVSGVVLPFTQTRRDQWQRLRDNLDLDDIGTDELDQPLEGILYPPILP